MSDMHIFVDYGTIEWKWDWWARNDYTIFEEEPMRSWLPENPHIVPEQPPVLTRYEGFRRLAEEYVKMQHVPREGPRVFSELYCRGFETAVETAMGRQEEGMTISWVRLAYDRAVDDLTWLERHHAGQWVNTMVALVMFEWGVYGRGHWEPFDFEELPGWLDTMIVGDVTGHQEKVEDSWNTQYWRMWPSGPEYWAVV